MHRRWVVRRGLLLGLIALPLLAPALPVAQPGATGAAPPRAATPKPATTAVASVISTVVPAASADVTNTTGGPLPLDTSGLGSLAADQQALLDSANLNLSAVVPLSITVVDRLG